MPLTVKLRSVQYLQYQQGFAPKLASDINDQRHIPSVVDNFV